MVIQSRNRDAYVQRGKGERESEEVVYRRKKGC